MTETEAKRIAQRYLVENPLEHPDYEWDLREWIEQTDGWVFPFCVRCKRDIPQDEWEQFGGAPAFLVRKGDGAVKVLTWSEYQETKQMQRGRTKPEGSEEFLERTREELAIRVKGRNVREMEGQFELREPGALYKGHFEPENDDIWPENTYPWNDYHESSGR